MRLDQSWPCECRLERCLDATDGGGPLQSQSSLEPSAVNQAGKPGQEELMLGTTP
jgi:hypothetical protein